MPETTAKPEVQSRGVPSKNVDSGIELGLFLKWDPSIIVENPFTHNFYFFFLHFRESKETKHRTRDT